MDYKKVWKPFSPKGIPKTSSKGTIVQGCITSHDLERLVEKVHELNQSEQEEPTKLDTEESTNETKTKSVTATEEEETDKEPNSPKLVEGSENPKPRVEPEEEPIKLSVEPKYTTPMPTFASISRKSELSMLMDMCKFMHNQQQTYWKYAKIRDDSIRNTFKNISNTLVFEFLDAIFETWMEDTDYTSRE
ncbi:hypothetical protein PVK06_011478 [Gossypium arboreum]|uniref:Uncharacterized protein n=1 Tax=Gossypium arboreum TaxID=29729 RepID=A0ABR0Q984_GOSAR|nr:hypothetical protein PVK06_011478 [Gossypium arboreum]